LVGFYFSVFLGVTIATKGQSWFLELDLTLALEPWGLLGSQDVYPQKRSDRWPSGARNGCGAEPNGEMIHGLMLQGESFRLFLVGLEVQRIHSFMGFQPCPTNIIYIYIYIVTVIYIHLYLCGDNLSISLSLFFFVRSL